MKCRRVSRLLSALCWLAAITPWEIHAAGPVTEVVGTGNSSIDIPAVQTAVDQGGEVRLKGAFSFDAPPTHALPPAFVAVAYPKATVLVSKSVAISGSGGDDEDRAVISAGTIPFYVLAPGASVRIERLRFVNPVAEAVLVSAAGGLTIASCRIEHVDPLSGFGSVGFELNTSGDIPTPANPGQPQNVSGPLLIANNEIDMTGGTATDNTVGIAVWSVGAAGGEVQAFITGNTITNFNEKGINIRRALGRVSIERNLVVSDTVQGAAPGESGIFVANLGSYLIADNVVRARWTFGQGYGIDVRTQARYPQWAITEATVVGNDIRMEAPASTDFGASSPSAGIDVFGNAQRNTIQGNSVRGHARTALLVTAQGGIASDNTFALNDVDEFDASVTDLTVDTGVMNTRIIGQGGSIEDLGMNTSVIPLAEF